MKPSKLYLLAVTIVVGVFGGAAEVSANSHDLVDDAAHAPAATIALSAEGRQVVALALAGDAGGRPFIVVDKRRARVFIFDAAGARLGATSALLGSAIGDDNAPGVGTMALARIPLADRTTPAGRFAASFGENTKGQPVLWVDYDAAIALHSVAITNPKEHRRERLASASLSDKRMSYGCINVPAAFFDTLVTAQFGARGGIVYVLPEVHALARVFTGLRGSGEEFAAGS